MRRDQLEHAIRTACQIIGKPAVIVVGSQAILGAFREEQLPAAATMPAEIDILPIADDNDETSHLADIIEGVGASSPPSRNPTASASTAPASPRPPCQRAGATGSSSSRTPVPQPRAGNRSTPDGAWARKTCAPPSSAPSGKRTRTSSRPSSTPSSSTAKPSSPGWPP